MANFWDAIKDTAESLGGALVAPAGAVVDLASAPFDDDDNDNIASIFLKRGGDFIDPLVNQDTISGFGIGKVFDALNTALDYGVNRPLSAYSTAVHHAQGTGSMTRVGGLMVPILSPDQWAEAWQISDEQNAGQAFATLSLDALGDPTQAPDIDPFDYENPYDDWTHPNYGGRATALSWSANVVGALALDPAYIAAKGVGALGTGGLGAAVGSDFLQFAGTKGKLTAAQRDELGAVLNGGSARASKRVDRWADFAAGANKEGRALTGPEILAATPELNRWANEPRLVASLVAEASKIGDDAVRRNTVKDILAFAGGDSAALDNLRSAKAAIPSIADELKNARKGSVLDLEKMAAIPGLKNDPAFIRHLEGQITRLNADGGIDQVVLSWENRLDLIESTWGTMSHLPGVHTGLLGRGGQAGRALARANDKGALRTMSNKAKGLEAGAVAKVDEWATKAANRTSHSVMIQKGLRTVPVLAIRATGLAASPYTKFPAAFGNAMRQTHFTGAVRFDEWDDALTQFDSMLKLSHADDLTRMNFISKAALAGNEMDKERMVREVEKLSMTSLTKHLGDKTGEAISPGYVEALMEDHFKRRGAAMSQLFGRAYAATKMTPAQQDETVKRAAMRQGSIKNINDEQTRLNSASKFNPKEDASAQWDMRVDQFLDDEGMPLALPLLESQLSNAMPLLDMHLAKKLVGREQSTMARFGRAWERQAKEIHGLEKRLLSMDGAKGRLKYSTAKAIEKRLQQLHDGQDFILEAGNKLNRAWKMSVLFRLGYPARVVLDDHWRIWSRIGAARFYADSAPEAFRNFGYNHVGRKVEGRVAIAEARAALASLKDEAQSDRILNYGTRLDAHKKAVRARSGHKGRVTKLRAQLDVEGVDRKAIEEQIAHHEQQIARFDAEAERLQQAMGDMSPEHIAAEIARHEEFILAGSKAARPDKRHIGSKDVTLSGGEVIEGSMAGAQGRAFRSVAGSDRTFDHLIRGIEEKSYGRADRGAHVTIDNTQPHHLDAWADALNNSIRNSRVAMFFVKGGDSPGFVKWINEPEQADLRRRLPHLAHDAEGWAARVENMILDYVPNDTLREALKNGTVSTKFLNKQFPKEIRPAVHGPMVADTLGTSDRTLGIGRALSDTFSWIATKPTDHLSRHPFFNSMYKMHAEELAEGLRIAARERGRKFTQDDLTFIERQARKAALKDLKRTLFDMSAHSHAAHMMRFISPFFAAHQEVLQRWGRIVAENPGIIRRAQQAFDAPRYAGLVIDENGDPVEPGVMPSPSHKLLLPIPGSDKSWSINENSFNLILQNGITNPGVGPLVQVPLETMAARYPEDTDVARVARLFSPFPPDSPTDAVMPATVKRLLTVIHGATGMNTGVGTREFNDMYATNLTDRVVDFHRKYGREPSQSEMDDIWEAAKHETTTEAFLRFVNNAASPFPAKPNSRYAAIQSGWYKLSEMGRQKYPDDFRSARDWAYDQFKEKYGEAYMALTYSDSNNKAGLAGTPNEVAAFKRYQGILKKTDQRLTRGVIGPALTALDEQGGKGVERSPEGREWFEDQGWITEDDPETAATEAQARRGWTMLDEITNSLNLAAEQAGLGSYVESDQLVAIRRAALDKIKAENTAFKADIESIDGDSYDSLIREMQQLVETPELRNDPTRTDIATLEAYLALRQQFVTLFDQRLKAGLGGPDAQASEPIRALYTKAVGKLAASNTFFESNFYNGVVENDPLLIGAN